METHIAGYQDELIDLLEKLVKQNRRTLMLCKMVGHMRYMRNLIISAELPSKRYKLAGLHTWMLKANMAYPKTTGIEYDPKSLEKNCNGYNKLLAMKWWHDVLRASYTHIIVVDNVDTEYTPLELTIIDKLDDIIGVTKLDM